ncbi:hypothetical protein cypCar_00006963 [Cyprinus carpio]|nr:hypothetical protein cypCar_00006963 [Cyprinus carpio]
MLCSVMDSMCINATHTLLFVERTPAKRTDHPKNQSRLFFVEMGPQSVPWTLHVVRQKMAVCCDDKIHCCPEDSVCDVEGSKCMSSTNQELPMWAKFPARLRAEWEDHKSAEMRAEAELTTTRQITTAGKQMTTLLGALPKTSDVPCNDTAACPDGSTCCKTKEGEWACCPLPQAVCCEDFIHCCPHGKKCNVALGTCEDPSCSGVPWVEQVPVKPIICQDKQSFKGTFHFLYSACVVKDFTHCLFLMCIQIFPCNDYCGLSDAKHVCKTKEGEWACCPLPQAVFVKTLPTAVLYDWLSHCCKGLKKERWALLSSAKAVCCEDFTHCCPHDQSRLFFVEKMDLRVSVDDYMLVRQKMCIQIFPCNDYCGLSDAKHVCKTKEGEWACCPLPQAVFVKTLPTAVLYVHSDVPCNDTAACPDGSTCCKTKEGGWSCCPLPQAVCCDDFIHCCPHGTTCNVAAGSCDETSGSQPWFEKLPVKLISSQNVAVTQVHSDVPCDDTVACADGTTCCKTQEGGWACCPLPQAVCCTDGEHCCPANYKCDVTRVSCIRGDVVIPWYNKMSSQSTPAPSLDLGAVECDEQSSCSADSTCCYLSTGEWGCCPLPEAVCCPDQQHCCPKGYRCDLRRRSCIKSTWLHVEIVPLAHIDDQKPQSSVSEKDIQCGGGHSCKDSETCCPTSQTTWGCCPSPKAVCCDDMKHCCPAGYKCGAGGTCTLAVGFDWNNWDNWRAFFAKNKRAIIL